MSENTITNLESHTMNQFGMVKKRKGAGEGFIHRKKARLDRREKAKGRDFKPKRSKYGSE